MECSELLILFMNVIITFVWVNLRNKNHAYFFVLKETDIQTE